MADQLERLEKMALATQRQVELVTRELKSTRRELADARQTIQGLKQGGGLQAKPEAYPSTRSLAMQDEHGGNQWARLRSSLGRRAFIKTAAALVALAGGAALAGRVSVSADTPTVINYQGRLTDASGNPLTGTYNMTFALYNTPTGGTAVWSENRNGANAVPVNNGLFSVMLGSVNPISRAVFDSGNLYLGVSVGSDPEMTPRELLGSVPYALQIPDGSVTTAKMASNAVTQRSKYRNDASQEPVTPGTPATVTVSNLVWSSIPKSGGSGFLEVALTTTGGDVLVSFGQMYACGIQMNINFGVFIDGVAATDGPIYWDETDSQGRYISGAYLWQNISAGAHTWRLYVAGSTNNTPISIYPHQYIVAIEIKR